MINKPHTPGPWFANEETYGTPPKVQVREKHGSGTLICMVGNTHASEDKILANARLIAAAPDLLEALKSIATEAAKSDEDCLVGILAISHGAIAKVLGS